MCISDWSSDVCSSDLDVHAQPVARVLVNEAPIRAHEQASRRFRQAVDVHHPVAAGAVFDGARGRLQARRKAVEQGRLAGAGLPHHAQDLTGPEVERDVRSEEYTSELQSLMRNSYAVFCLKKQQTRQIHQTAVTTS